MLDMDETLDNEMDDYEDDEFDFGADDLEDEDDDFDFADDDEDFEDEGFEDEEDFADDEEDFSDDEEDFSDDEEDFSDDEEDFSDDEEEEFEDEGFEDEEDFGDDEEDFSDEGEEDEEDFDDSEEPVSSPESAPAPQPVINNEPEEYKRGSCIGEMSDEMKAEYDSAFSGEEKAQNLLKLTSDKYTITLRVIKTKEIGLTEPAKLGRKRTIAGLTQSVRDMGITTPIHVMRVADEDASEDYKYIMIDGMRRMFAAVKNGMEEIQANVWDFDDKDRGMELLLPLSLMLNRQQRRQWSEIWDLYRVLELQSAITPGTLEFLLQLEGGEAMKLKDVMLCEYSEVKEALLSGEKGLDACYKMLAKLRKEEDQLAKDDATGFGDTVEDATDITTDVTAEGGQLSDQDVLELLEMVDSMDEDDIDSDNFDALAKPDDAFIDQQKVGERHPLDPALRQAVLARDDFTCKCCGMRMVGARLGLVAVHHVIPVHCSGKDTLDNLTTLCVGCHILLHIFERNGGTIMMSEEDFNNLMPTEKTSLKRALKLARVAIEADKRKGMSRDQIAKETQASIKHPMPGVGMKETQAMYNAVEASKKMNDEE